MNRRTARNLLAAGGSSLLVALAGFFFSRLKVPAATAPDLRLPPPAAVSAPEEVKALLGLPPAPETKPPAFSGPEAKRLYGSGEKRQAVSKSTGMPKMDYIASLRGFAEQGNIPAQNLLGESYMSGRGVKQDFAEAFKWFRKSADRGNAAALFHLGSLYYTGSGVGKDTAAALECLSKAADGAYAPAQAALGTKYLAGEDLPADQALGLKWLRKAGEGGYGPAQFQLAAIFYYGRGVAVDKPEALKWFRLAGEGGNAQAQFNAGLMLAKGDGVPLDHLEACKWLTLASEAPAFPQREAAAKAAAALRGGLPPGTAARLETELEGLRAALRRKSGAPRKPPVAGR